MRPSLVSALVLALIVSPANLPALDPGHSIGRYLHTSWTQEQGIDLPAVLALAQTSDGYLWLGTDRGLIRFDGMRFVPWEPVSGERLPEKNVRILKASSKGGLWIATDKSVLRLDDRGQLKRVFTGLIAAGLEDAVGQFWVLSSQSRQTVTRLTEDGMAREYGPADGLPAENIRALLEDSHSHLWIGTESKVCRWLPGTPAECLHGPRVNVNKMAKTPSGDLLIVDDLSRSVVRVSNGRLQPASSPQGNRSLNTRDFMQDRGGNTWIATGGQGLLRLKNGNLEQFTRQNGLSSDMVWSLQEDFEGNMWVGTARGIDRFRDPRVLKMSTPDGLSSEAISAVFRGDRGDIWVGTSGGGLNRVTGEKVTRHTVESGLPGTSIISLFRDAGGKLWTGTSGGLAYFSDGRFFEVLTADGKKLDRVLAFANGPGEALWVVNERTGLFEVRRNVAYPLRIREMEGKNISRLAVDRNQLVWVGYREGGISAIRNNAVVQMHNSRADGLADGIVQDIVEDRSGSLWVGTATGLSRLCNGIWTTWRTEQGIPGEGVRGIVEDDHGALWLITAQGLSRMPIATLDQSPDGRPQPLSLSFYGQSDGLRLGSSAGMANPRVAKADDGQLWISTNDGVAIVDPSRIRTNHVPPPVAIEQMLVDGRPMTDDPAAEIAFRGRLVQFTYTGLSLMVPERVRFKYKLEGRDGDWIDAGGRRNAAYADLRPGKYRFRVIASNNDGLWNEAGAALGFRVDPYFYQTSWFLALCIILPSLAIYGIYRFRMQQVVTHFRLVADERARLTREIHDSLMQGFAGVVYQLEAVVRQIDSAPQASKQRLERAIDQADRSLTETRHTIQCMRIPALENSTLPEALSAVAKQLTEGASVVFHLDVKGRVSHLSYDEQAVVYLIGREAIANAVNHAHATRIDASLTYSDKGLRLRVEDNGAGFDSKTAKQKPGHWGIVSMQERAKQIHATFTVDSTPGKGTSIEVVVPRKRSS